MHNLDVILTKSSLTPQDIADLSAGATPVRANPTLKSEWRMQQSKGARHIEQMACEDIREALHLGDIRHARELYATLTAFVAEQPEFARSE